MPDTALPSAALTTVRQLDALPQGTVIRPLRPSRTAIDTRTGQPATEPLQVIAYRPDSSLLHWSVTGHATLYPARELLRLAPAWGHFEALPTPAEPQQITVDHVIRITVDPKRWADEGDLEPELDDPAEFADFVRSDLAEYVTEFLPKAIARSMGDLANADATVTLLDPETADARDEKGDWWTCSLHGGAITQDCDCTPAAGLGDLQAAAEALWVASGYRMPLPLHPGIRTQQLKTAAAVVAAYHGVKAARA